MDYALAKSFTGGTVTPETEAKLDAIIASTNRTTRAVRAFVRFLFIQLTAITLAILIFNLGNLTQDTSECAFGVCPPSAGWTIFAGLIWLVGLVWSSYAGWSELELSDPSIVIRQTLQRSPLGGSAANGVFGGYSADSFKCKSCDGALEPSEQFCGNCGARRSV